MPVDFSKYGGTSSSTKTDKKEVKGRVDFSKYQPQQEETPVFESRPITSEMKPAYDLRKSDLVQKSQVSKNSEPVTKDKSWQDDSSRNLPVIGPILKGLDWVANTPVTETISDLGKAFYTPGAGVSAVNALTRGAESLVAKALPNLVKTTAGRAGSKALSEGIVGVPLGVAGAQIMDPDATMEDYIRGALFGGAAGGSIGAAGVGLGALGRSAINDIKGPANRESAIESFRTNNQRLDDFYNEMSAKYGEGNTNKWSMSDNMRFRSIDRDLDNSVLGLNKFDVSDAELFSRPQSAQGEILALPPGRRDVRMEAARNRGAMAGNETVIPAADIPANALPAGNYQRPQRLRVNNNNETLDYVMRQIKDDVQQDMRDLPIYTKAVEAAAKRGYDLPKLLEGQAPKVADKVTRNAQERVAGVYPTEAPNIARPASFNKQVVSEAAPIVTRVGARPSGSNPKVTITAPQRRFAPTGNNGLPEAVQPNAPTVSSRSRGAQVQRNQDELKFGQTVRESPNTSEGLVRELNERPPLGSRTSDVINRQQAAKLIEKHGMEGLYDKLVSKRLHLSPSENTAAQILAKHFSSLGDKESMAKAISLVSKTAKEGREMGQAIQALSQWNKLDETGALLLGERKLNQGVRDTADWKSLTPEQAAPIQAAAQKIGTAQETKSLADEVLNIVTNKKPGEVLSDAEKAIIQKFHQQVKEINDKAKNFLPHSKSAKAEDTIKEVSAIPPKSRTRDQVVNYMEAKAEKAKQRLRAKGIQISSGIDPGIVADHVIIGAYKIAKGAVKFSDFSEQMIREYGRSLQPHMKDLYLRSTNMFRKDNGLPTVQELDRVVNQAVKSKKLDAETAESLKVMAKEIGFIADNNLKLEATQDLQLALRGLGESTLGQKLATIQTGAQLLNVVTMARNIIGNTALIAAEKINKLSAVPIDWTLSKFTGERTIQFFPKNQQSMFRDYMTGTSSGWKGVSSTGTLSSYDIHPEVFGKRNPLKYISKSLGASLQGFDQAAYHRARGEVLATYAEQLGKSQGLSKSQIKQQMPELIQKLDQRIHDLADEAGTYAVFQDETLLSQAAVMLKKGLNKITDLPSQHLVERGVIKKSMSLEGFGLGDIVLKYAKTPANLVMRGIDYSPLGFVRATMELSPLFLNKAKFNQFEATRALSRAITGTLGLTGMGYVLADAGILTGTYSLDKDVRSIEEQAGRGSYKVNWSALGRFITSGLDKEAAKFKEGDTLMDYAWLQPAAISLAMGVNANKAINKNKDEADTSGWKVMQDALVGGLASVLENPMVQGISNVIDAGTELVKQKRADKFKRIIKGVPATFVPTLLNQGRASTDNLQRETFDENIFVEMGNLMKNKVPGLSKTLTVSYDSLGNPRQRIQGGQENTVKQYLTSFFSPARMTEYEVSPEARTVLKLMEESGDATVLPHIVDRYIMVDNPITKKEERLNLDAEQFAKLQRKVGQEVTSKLAEKADFLSNPNVKLENKVKRVKEILTDVGSKARNEVRVEMGYKKKR